MRRSLMTVSVVLTAGILLAGCARNDTAACSSLSPLVDQVTELLGRLKPHIYVDSFDAAPPILEELTKNVSSIRAVRGSDELNTAIDQYTSGMFDWMYAVKQHNFQELKPFSNSVLKIEANYSRIRELCWR